MKLNRKTYCTLVTVILSFYGFCQDMASTEFEDESYEEAFELAYQGKHQSAKRILAQAVNDEINNDLDARFLLARTYSWSGQYDKARDEFNKITSSEKENGDFWIAAIKNELYAKTYAIALGLANKAALYIKNDEELRRLKTLALEGINQQKYGEKGWYNQEGAPVNNKTAKKHAKKNGNETTKSKKSAPIEESKTTEEAEKPKNRIGVNNAFTVFSERYEPVVFSSVTFRHQTKIGSVIPRVNYSNRSGQHGLQYDIDFYPKFLKRFYAYLNYGYSNSTIFPRQKFGGDIYVNLPNAIEFSAGGRYISTNTQDIRAITNSLGYYKGNYYFSLRSFVSPRENNLLSVSGNLLIRKYLRDAENFMGISVGLGFSPELRQFFSGGELLSETVLFVGSQRLNLQYQFTPKKSPNIYRANLGVRRQEFAFAAGTYFWAISAGLTYEVKF
ncbi:hypothetical protein MTsPCn5_06320 [Croceitalea sp. MTPC5]|nr:hypothetical protein MTsPCn5_06320 [Croceitalea sp. MTPC5]